jgi:hypothetical protein
MTPLQSKQHWHISKAQLWLIRILILSLPAALILVAINCVRYQVPNRISIIPKSVIALIIAATILSYWHRFEMAIRSEKVTFKMTRNAGIWIPVMLVIFWAVVFFFRNSLSFTAAGDPVFPILWFILSMMSWSLDLAKFRKMEEAQ